MPAIYDTIGIDYASLRRPDPRIAERIRHAIGDARTVLNVGAGTGSYEPGDCEVTALEPSETMLRQRPPSSAPAIQGMAEELPFPDQTFDVAMAVLTVHHWSDRGRGMREMRRVARHRVVILTYDPAARPWLTEYFPALAELDETQMPPMGAYGEALGPVRIEAVPVPHDCLDGFLHAWWRRPAAYLDPRIRSGSSSFWKLPDVKDGLSRLAADLESGAWEDRYGCLLAQDELDVGYRLVTTI